MIYVDYFYFFLLRDLTILLLYHSNVPFSVFSGHIWNIQTSPTAILLPQTFMVASQAHFPAFWWICWIIVKNVDCVDISTVATFPFKPVTVKAGDFIRKESCIFTVKFSEIPTISHGRLITNASPPNVFKIIPAPEQGAESKMSRVLCF